MPEPSCINCGCTEEYACMGGCGWTWLNRETGNGLCTQCHDRALLKYYKAHFPLTVFNKRLALVNKLLG